jgi:hypothetical protein
MVKETYYDTESKKIIDKMLAVLYRASRKVDDKKYRETLLRLDDSYGGNK